VSAADPAAGISALGVWVFTIDPTTGAIAPVGIPILASINLPFYFELAAESSGNFVFTKSTFLNPNLSVVDAFRVDRSSGALTLVNESRKKFANRINAMALSNGPTPVNYVPQFAYIANSGDNTVSAYSIDPSSGLLTSKGSVSTGTNPQSVATDPSGKFLYVANQGSNNLSGYVIDATTGLPTTIPGSPFATGSQPVSVTVEPSGRFVYVSNSGDNSVSVYAISPASGVLTLASTSSLAANGSGGGCTVPGPLTVDSRGLIIYVSCPASSNTFLAQINPSTGAVGECSTIWGIPSPLGAPLGGDSISIHPSGKFAYLLNQANGVIYELAVTDNQSGCVSGGTGSITLNSTIAVGPTQNIALDPHGRFLYGAGGASNDLLGDLIDFNTGALSPIPGSPFGAGTFPLAIAFDGSGRFAYVVNKASNTVSAYSVDPSTGALAPLPIPDLPTGTGPVAVTTSTKIQ
jgi:6-phosphogluconolactonase